MSVSYLEGFNLEKRIGAFISSTEKLDQTLFRLLEALVSVLRVKTGRLLLTAAFKLLSPLWSVITLTRPSNNSAAFKHRFGKITVVDSG